MSSSKLAQISVVSSTSPARLNAYTAFFQTLRPSENCQSQFQSRKHSCLVLWPDMRCFTRHDRVLITMSLMQVLSTKKRLLVGWEYQRRLLESLTKSRWAILLEAFPRFQTPLKDGLSKIRTYQTAHQTASQESQLQSIIETVDFLHSEKKICEG